MISFRKAASLFVLSIACLGSAILSGCAGTVVDSQKAEDAIAQNVEDQTGVQVKSVDCPDDVQVRKGTTFDCQIVTKDGFKATATLKIANNEADVSIIKLTGSGVGP